MKLEIIKKEESPLMAREVVVAKVDFDKETPSRMDLKNQIASKVGAKAELVIVEKIDNAFGEKSASVTVHVYKNEEDLKKNEASKYVKNNTKQAEKPKEEKKAEKPAEAPKEGEAKPAEEAPKAEEKPAEEKKEEPKAEVKE